MHKIKCGECGKTYDYDEDAFCSNCGAFNQPPRTERLSRVGTAVRRDGLNEANHEGSFVHRELHTEDRERKRTGLEKTPRRSAKPLRPAPVQNSVAAETERQRRKNNGKHPAAVVAKIVFIIIFLNILVNILTLLFSRF